MRKRVDAAMPAPDRRPDPPRLVARCRRGRGGAVLQCDSRCQTCDAAEVCGRRPSATEYVLHIATASAAPDEGPSAAALLVNGMLPGPEIRVREGDTLRVLVENGLTMRPRGSIGTACSSRRAWTACRTSRMRRSRRVRRTSTSIRSGRAGRTGTTRTSAFRSSSAVRRAGHRTARRCRACRARRRGVARRLAAPQPERDVFAQLRARQADAGGRSGTPMGGDADACGRRTGGGDADAAGACRGAAMAADGGGAGSVGRPVRRVPAQRPRRRRAVDAGRHARRAHPAAPDQRRRVDLLPRPPRRASSANHARRRPGGRAGRRRSSADRHGRNLRRDRHSRPRRQLHAARRRPGRLRPGARRAAHARHNAAAEPRHAELRRPRASLRRAARPRRRRPCPTGRSARFACRCKATWRAMSG